MKKIQELENLCTQIRRDILRMVHANNSGHPGGSLGCTEQDCPDEPGDDGGDDGGLGPNSLTLTNVDLDAGTLDLYMTNDESVGGFQISFNGISITSASGGSAEDAGFMLSTSDSMILGFSLTGATIADGEGTLITVDVDPISFT